MSATYTIGIVPTPVFSQASTIFRGFQEVIISCKNPDAKIYYTIDGSIPSENEANSILYTGTIIVNSTITIKARGFLEGLAPSALASATYTQGSSGPGGDYNEGRTGQMTWNQGGTVDIGLTQYGSISVLSASSSSASFKAMDVNGDYFYITGKEDSQVVIKEMKVTSNNEGYLKNVKLDGQATPPSAYPNSFILNGERYLLFGYAKQLKLYKYSSENDKNVYFITSNLWNFDNITSTLSSSIYTKDNGPWLTNPVYNLTLNKLYFTLIWRVFDDDMPEDYRVYVRLFQSELLGNTFTSPTEITGEIDPRDSSHWDSGAPVDRDKLVPWVGRLYISRDGRKAFFNCMSCVAKKGANEMMKENDPFIAPIPNYQEWGPDVTNAQDPKIIDTYILAADVDPITGVFSNVRQLPALNQGGINYVADISSDGTKLYVAHMVLDADFWNNGTYGADGLTLDLCYKAPYEISVWKGKIEVVDCP